MTRPHTTPMTTPVVAATVAQAAAEAPSVREPQNASGPTVMLAPLQGGQPAHVNDGHAGATAHGDGHVVGRPRTHSWTPARASSEATCFATAARSHTAIHTDRHAPPDSAAPARDTSSGKPRSRRYSLAIGPT